MRGSLACIPTGTRLTVKFCHQLVRLFKFLKGYISVKYVALVHCNIISPLFF